MKHLSLGLAFGLSAGFVLSLLKDKDGHRLGEPLKENLENTKIDAVNLQQNLAKAKNAVDSLTTNMPTAETAINGIQSDISNFRTHTERNLNEMQYHANKLEEKINNLENKPKKK